MPTTDQHHTRRCVALSSSLAGARTVRKRGALGCGRLAIRRARDGAFNHGTLISKCWRGVCESREKRKSDEKEVALHGE